MTYKENYQNGSLSYEKLSQFEADSTRHVTAFPNVFCTRGIQYLAEQGNADWLVNAIASFLSADIQRRKFVAMEPYASHHYWILEVADDHSAVLTARAGSDLDIFVCKRIEHTDFSRPNTWIWVRSNAAGWTLFLPSELKGA